MTTRLVMGTSMNSETEPQRIVRVLAFALRHQPLRFGVTLDGEGFADLDELVLSIRFSHYDWTNLDRERVEDAIRGTGPGRLEIRGGRARACYGRSVRLGSPGSGDARRSSFCIPRRPKAW